jgi:hypothetical protein
VKEYIIETFKKSKGNAYKVMKKNVELVDILETRYPHVDDFRTKVQLYIRDMDDIPVCQNSKCDNNVRFLNGEFNNFCSMDCTIKHRKENNLYKEMHLKSLKTNLERYGVEHPLQNSEIREKTKQTNIERYGVEHQMQNPEIKEKIKQTNLERYGVENPFQNTEIREKIKQTNIERYGAEHPLQNSEIMEKIKQTNLERYGVESYSQTDEFIETIKKNNLDKHGVEYYMQTDEFKEKVKSGNLDRYGVAHYSQTTEYKNNIIKTNIEKYGTESSKRSHFNPDYMSMFDDKDIFEKMLYEHGTYKLAEMVNCNVSTIHSYSNKNNIQLPPRPKSYQEEQITDFLIKNNIPFISNSRKVLSSGKELDFYFPEHLLAIEINGLYWHSEISGGRDRNYHYSKWKECDDLYITLLSINEDEFISNQNFWFNKILYMTGKLFLKKIHARKCEIRELNNVTEFLNEHHLQGSNSSRYKFGLFYDNQLVSVMTFSNTRNNKVGTIELSRFCNHSDYLVSGGASKLLSYFIKNHGSKYKEIISFSDNNYSNGHVYKTLGFTLLDYLKPDYKYICTKNYLYKYHKSGFRKSEIFRKFEIPDVMKVKSEWDLMQYLGYDRIWDSGKMKWSLTI